MEVVNRNSLKLPLWSALFALGLAACGSDGALQPSVTASASPSSFAAGGMTTVSVAVQDFTLRSPDHAHSALTAAQHSADEVSAEGGHYHIYLDSTEVNPLKMAWTTSTTIAVDAAPGPHTLIIRLNADDHRFLVPEVKATVDITLE